MGKNDFCVAFGCNHHRGYGATCQFFTFPDDPVYFEAWVNACKREVIQDGKRRRWVPSKYQKLCSCHFEEGSRPNPKSRSKDNKLKMPTLFAHRPVPRRRPVSKWMTRNEQADKSVPVKPLQHSEESIAISTHLSETKQESDVEEAAEYNDGFMEVQRNGHDYMETVMDTSSTDTFKKLEQDDPEFFEHMQQLEQDSLKYNRMTEKNQVFKLDLIEQKPDLFQFYSGLELSVFNALFAYLEKKVSRMQYFHGQRTTQVAPFNLDGKKTKPGVRRSLSLREELFSVLYRLQCGHSVAECAIRFGISESQFSRNFTTWITLLGVELEMLCKNAEPDDEVPLAKCFKSFQNLRVILDCTELFSETPSSVENHRQVHSNYKHHSTIKFLVGIHPTGAVTYISNAYGGRASDKYITQDSVDLIQSLEPGQKVMVDRGFTIEDDLPIGVKLIIPAFKGSDRQQITPPELVRSKVISRARVHVERCMRRIKSFNILRQELKLSQVDVYEQIFKTCAYLVNFQSPYLKAEKE